MLTYADVWQVRAALCGALLDSRTAALQQVLTQLALLLQKHLRYWYKRTLADAAGGGSAEMARMSLKYMWEEVWKQVRCADHVC
jgi:hypothetical protein